MKEVKNKYVVYGHYYNDELFYIGSGRIYTKEEGQISRPYDYHSGRSSEWFDFCSGETDKIKVEILFQTNDRKESLYKETEITRMYIEKGFHLANKHIGTRISAETKIKMSEIRKGMKYSTETRNKMSLAHKGKVPSNAKKY